MLSINSLCVIGVIVVIKAAQEGARIDGDVR